MSSHDVALIKATSHIVAGRPIPLYMGVGNSKDPRRLVYAAIICCTLFFGLRAGWNMVDFTAFVCGGETIAQGQDPYAMAPLHACENRRFLEMGDPAEALITLPAPLPPYAFTPFILLARLPPIPATLIWSGLTVGVLAATVLMLRDLTRLPTGVVVGALIVPDAYVSLPLGQIVPLTLGLMIASLWCVQKGRPVLGSIAALCATVEPHLGGALCLILFAVERRARPILVGGAVILAALSVRIASPHLTYAYLTSVLRAHAATEVRNDYQLGLPHALSVSGVPDSVALLLGSITMAVVLAAALIAGIILARRPVFKSAALLLVPALGVAAGTFVHTQQYAIVGAFALTVLAVCRSVEGCDSNGVACRDASLGLVLTSLYLVNVTNVIDVVMVLTVLPLVLNTLPKARRLPAWCIAACATSGTFFIHRLRIAGASAPHVLAAHAQRLAWFRAHATTADAYWNVKINESPFLTALGPWWLLFELPAAYGVYLLCRALGKVYTDGVSERIKTYTSAVR